MSECDCLTCKIDRAIRQHYSDVLEPAQAAHVIEVFAKILGAMLGQDIMIAGLGPKKEEEIPDDRVVN